MKRMLLLLVVLSLFGATLVACGSGSDATPTPAVSVPAVDTPTTEAPAVDTPTTEAEAITDTVDMTDTVDLTETPVMLE
jgi:uncharacterized lipoprotein YbaY